MKLKTVLFICLISFGLETFAFQISLNNPPGDYRVFSLRGRNLGNLTYAKNFEKFSFNVPDKYIIKNPNGSPNLVSSLRNWRRSTPVADGNPRTKNGVGYYPFKDSNGKNRYIALEHIYRNRRSVVSVASKKDKSKEVEIDISKVFSSNKNLSYGQTLGSVESSPKKLDPNDLARRAMTGGVSADVSGYKTAAQNGSGGELGSSLRPVLRPSKFKTMYATPSVFRDEFLPRKASFSTRRKTAHSYTNSMWERMSYKQKAEYMDKKYDQLLRAHGLRNTYSPKVLVCKSYKESNFRPQIKTSNPLSTASGVSQITRSTAIDTFSRGRWFRSKVEGFTHIRNGREFHRRMANSMLAQMEFGMAILDQKRRDRGLSKSGSNIDSILQGYYGSYSKNKNRKYSNKILSCMRCVEQFGYSNKCLERAR